MKHQVSRFAINISLIFLATVIVGKLVIAEDWPTYQHDNRLSGITAEQLKLPLSEQWRYISKHAPRNAWPLPAKTDFWHHMRDLRPRVTYDWAFQMAAVGDSVYFSSSADDKVYCLDASTGQERWCFFTEGPVRFAPTVWDGKVYCGSDDGYVYCLRAKDGELIWKYKAAPEERRVPGNGRIISVWPVRSGVAVEDGIAYFCSGLFPSENVYLCSLDARDGRERWKQKTALSPQGYILASSTKLYVPTGRTAPVVFNREDGKRLGVMNYPRAGETYALLTDDMRIPGPGTGVKSFGENESDRIARYNGRQMIVSKSVSYLLADAELAAIDRAKYATVIQARADIAREQRRLAEALKGFSEKQQAMEGRKLARRLKDLEGKEYRWRRPGDSSYYSMVLAGDILFVGGDKVVDAFRVEDGKKVWSRDVMGKAYGLAMANGRLFVSTDEGVTHCFGEGISSEISEVKPLKSSSPYPDDGLAEVYAWVARRIVEETGVKKGYCLVVGLRDGRLAYELARRTELQVICVDEERERVERARKSLDRAGLYGVRISVHEGNLSDLSYADYFANLIVSERVMFAGEVPSSARELFRVLSPGGGVAYLGQPEGMDKRSQEVRRAALEDWLREGGIAHWQIVEDDGLWAVIRRGKLAGAGEWTHLYANAHNTAGSGDSLVRSPTRVQWFGRPGPRPMMDRHHRSMSPLAKDGRLFIPANDRVIAVDAYNGTILWDVEAPNSRRVGMPRDCGQAAAADDYLYIAVKDECWGLEVSTGRHSLTLKTPQLLVGEQRYWGYLAWTDDLILGSGEKPGAARTSHSRTTIMDIYWDKKPIVTSDYLFGLNRHRGEVIWTSASGVIINPAIAVGDEHVYFVESRNPEAKQDSDGRITLDVLLAEGAGYLVALDKRTGDKAWERPVDFPFEHAIYLSYANNVVLAVGSKNQRGHPHYYLYGFEANSGNPKWRQNYATAYGVNGDHGEQDQHAVVIGNTIYAYSQPCDYNLQTGAPGTFQLVRGGHGCGTLSGSNLCLFGRGGNPRMYELKDGGKTNIALNQVNRPSCWINIIPACGLILIPEGSSGCTCSYPLQTSIAFAPKRESREENR